MHNHSLQSDEGTGKPKSKSKSHHASLITLEPPNLSPLETPPKLEKNFSFLGHLHLASQSALRRRQLGLLESLHSGRLKRVQQQKWPKA